MVESIVCEDINAMHAVAIQLAGQIKAPAVVTFEGPLGAGKTTFIQGLLKAWGYEERVTSPTFALVQEYHQVGDHIKFDVAHFDLYRLNHPAELESIGFRDYLEPNMVCLIEWPSKGGDEIPKADYHLQLAHHPLGRSIIINKP